MEFTMIKSTIMAIAISTAAIAATGTSASAMTGAPLIQQAVTQSGDTAEIIQVKRRGGRRHRRFHKRFFHGHWGHYGHYYGGGCYWLKKKAMYTGSHYWWKRYKYCKYGYSY